MASLRCTALLLSLIVVIVHFALKSLSSKYLTAITRESGDGYRDYEEGLCMDYFRNSCLHSLQTTSNWVADQELKSGYHNTGSFFFRVTRNIFYPCYSSLLQVPCKPPVRHQPFSSARTRQMSGHGRQDGTSVATGLLLGNLK